MFTKEKRGNEVSGLVVIFLAILLFLSLISHHPGDPLWTSRDSHVRAKNIMGVVGAGISSLLLVWFGMTSFLLVLILILLAVDIFKGKNAISFLIRYLGLSLLLLSTASLLQLTLRSFNYHNQILPAGGLIGIEVGRHLLTYLNEGGAIVASITALLLSIIVLTGLSVSEALTKLTEIVKAVIKGASSLIVDFFERERRAREKRKLIKRHFEEREKREIKTKIRISLRGKRAAEPEEEPLTREQRLKRFALPPLSLLSYPPNGKKINQEELRQGARAIVEKFREFAVEGSVVQIHPGPVVTTFEFKPAPGIKYSRIINLIDDLCLALRAESIRMNRIAGKSTVGIEVANTTREVICLREILESESYQSYPSKLTLALGKTINGGVYITDLAKMPHLLVAGATGSGKSVALNNMIASILFKATPSEVKFVMIDTKRLELGIYEDFPYLLTPVVVEPKHASNALKWAVEEMEARLKKMAMIGSRDITHYNQTTATIREQEPLSELTPLPYLVIVIDELADLMIFKAATVEESLTRLAQMGRAAGIHLMIATQRPSVDVITGIIKANFPCRISFRVSSKIDSRTVIDVAGAEKLLGKGDMLFLPPGSSSLIRVHGALITDEETTRMVEFLKRQAKPSFDYSVTEEPEIEPYIPEEERDEFYQKAVELVIATGYASVSQIQRKLRLGYNRAARMVELMEEEGIVGPPEGSKPRRLLVGPDYLDRLRKK
jgi:S-DNA-T family DNA segregation ATPase FtsK/SpoIIIE